MPTQVAVGIQTSSVGTEVVAVGASAANNYVFVVNTTAMALGDKAKIVVRLLAFSTIGDVYCGAYQHIQATPFKLSIPVPVVTGGAIRGIIHQTEGTARPFPWEIDSL